MVIYSDNTTIMECNEKIAAQIFKASGRLLWELALWKHACQTSPFSTLHIAGILIELSDSLSKSFRYKKIGVLKVTRNY